MHEEQRTEIEGRLREARAQRKRGQQATVILEAQLAEADNDAAELRSQMQAVEQRIAEIDLHALHLVDALFAQVEMGYANEPSMLKMRDMVMALNKHYHEV